MSQTYAAAHLGGYTFNFDLFHRVVIALESSMRGAAKEIKQSDNSKPYGLRRI